VTGTDPGAYTTAFVVRHVESALGAAAATDIAQLQISSVPSSMVNGSERVWLYDGPHGQAERLEEFLPQGPLVVDTGGHDLADWTRHPDGGRLQRENLVPEAVPGADNRGQPVGLPRFDDREPPDAETETIWVDPATYLPVRMVSTSSVFVGVAYNIRWLPPTRTNLALLTVPIPAGFTQVAPSR
jgi:hypothetical protein